MCLVSTPPLLWFGSMAVARSDGTHLLSTQYLCTSLLNIVCDKRCPGPPYLYITSCRRGPRSAAITWLTIESCYSSFGSFKASLGSRLRLLNIGKLRKVFDGLLIEHNIDTMSFVVAFPSESVA